jgi:hypothetical protein
MLTSISFGALTKYLTLVEYAVAFVASIWMAVSLYREYRKPR